ncbi:ATP-grasp domain-containing protein [Fastidiosibacter lacustris]|uniref:ATP-grasp domain-containing protein n=1 Tax=Fastidiosibacter lacustris TaxID=2056695 RepID=UPI00130022E3|nr:ATP-grasp domain-containing protein [Fastidiosibacter lacustris]
MRNNNILIVDPFSTGALYADAFTAQGYDVYCLISNEQVPAYLIGTLDKAKYKHLFYSYEECVRFFSQHGLYIAVAGGETGVYFADKLNSLFKINANQASSSSIRRDKYLMQIALKENDLRHICSYEILSQDQDLTKFLKYSSINSINRWIIKPLNSAGSDGVISFDSVEHIYAYLAQYNWQRDTAIGEKCRGLVLQEFIAGDEYVVDLVKSESKYFIASLCKYTKVGETGLVYHCLDIIDPSDTKYNDLVQYAIECANALELVKGPMHMEFMKDDKGFVMIEAGARLHGGVAPSFFKSCYEPHLLAYAVDSFLGKMFDCTYATKLREGRIVFLHVDSDGIMPMFEAQYLPKFESLTSYQGHKWFVPEGKPIPKTKSLFDCPGIIWLAHKDINIVNEDEKTIRDMFCFNSVTI